MKVAFERATLDCEAAFRHLSAIRWMFIDGRHKWIIPDLDVIRRSQWLEAEGSSFRRNTIAFAEKAARSLEQPDVRVLPNGESRPLTRTCWELPADTAESVLRQPVTIVVENAKCDGAFLRFVLFRVGEPQLRRRLGPDGFARLRQHWQNPLGDDQWFSVRHGGGSTTATQIELLVEVAPTATRRLFSLVDSDRAAPGDPQGPTADAVVSTCHKLSAEHPGLRLDVWVLRKREVENYLPRTALAKFARKKVEQWDLLDEEARDHVDLKQLCGSRLWTIMLEPHADQLFHVTALRERGGAELASIVDRLIALL